MSERDLRLWKQANARLEADKLYMKKIQDELVKQRDELQAEVDRQTDVIKSDQKMRQENFTLWETNAALQAEVERLKYPDNCAIEIDGKGYYIEPAAYRKIKSLQAEEERLLRILRANVDSEVWEWVITGVKVDVDGEPTGKDDE